MIKLHALTFGQPWSGKTVGLDDHYSIPTEIFYYILNSIKEYD